MLYQLERARLPGAQPARRVLAEDVRVLAGVIGEHGGLPLGPVQPVRDAEVGGGLAGPPPGFDRDRLLDDVQVGRDRIQVGRLPERVPGAMLQ